MEKFGDRIRKAREKAGLSKAALSRMIGASRTIIADWENGEYYPTPKYAIPLAQALGIPLTALNRYGAGGVVPDAGTNTLVPLLKWDELKHLRRDDMSALPKATAYIQAQEGTPESSIALVIEDDSMLPVFQAGETIIVDRNLDPVDGDYIVVRVGSPSGYVLRRYAKRRGDAYDLQAENPDWSTVTVNSQTLAEVIGVVTEHRKRLRRP